MKIKKYLVKSIDEAIAQIKRDLGKDAYILSQEKVVKRGTLNLANVEMLEVTAAVDDNRHTQENFSASLLNRKYNFINPPKDDEVDLKGLKTELQPLTREMAEIKSLLRKSTTGLNGFNEFKGIYMELFMDLAENGVERKLAARFIETLQYQVNNDPHFDNTNDRNANLKEKYPIDQNLDYPGEYSPLRKKGAEAHLKTYADILDIPFYPVYNERDLRSIIDQLTDYELIFVDTTGLSPHDKQGLAIMEKRLSGVPPAEREVYLILSAPTRTEDLYLIFEKYCVFKPNKLIFTKIDETAALGNLFNLKMRTDIPMAYFTTGQKVPEDIEIAYPRKLARRIFLENIKGDNT
ncbi:MAG: hypothetical protein MUF15_28345 [Acidobacteria bacterium]|nr:hypothetical protein [Acidobacteriota bacterium]